eukprot:scaffold25063_cov62-Phaeocystis_antarctica.AAC.1
MWIADGQPTIPRYAITTGSFVGRALVRGCGGVGRRALECTASALALQFKVGVARLDHGVENGAATARRAWLGLGLGLGLGLA